MNAFSTDYVVTNFRSFVGRLADRWSDSNQFEVRVCVWWNKRRDAKLHQAKLPGTTKRRKWTTNEPTEKWRTNKKSRKWPMRRCDVNMISFVFRFWIAAFKSTRREQPSGITRFGQCKQDNFDHVQQAKKKQLPTCLEEMHVKCSMNIIFYTQKWSFIMFWLFLKRLKKRKKRNKKKKPKRKRKRFEWCSWSLFYFFFFCSVRRTNKSAYK